MQAHEVFTPTGFPVHTYVHRADGDLETDLRRALATPGMVSSLSGPSKSGKTVLMRRVVSSDLLISVGGAAIAQPVDLWNRVLNWMDAPSRRTDSSSRGSGVNVDAKAEAGLSALFAKAKGQVGGGASYDYARGSDRTYERGGLDQVIRELAGSDFTVFVDDFHYMPKDVQITVARHIKEAAERGVRVCTASVPHLKDNVVRSNPELRGRVFSIEFSYWSSDEVRQIGEKGFRALGVNIPEWALARIAAESVGSPQLMQQICLQLCYHLKVDTPAGRGKANGLNKEDIRDVLKKVAATVDFSSAVKAVGRLSRRPKRILGRYRFRDQTQGDEYRAVLLALRRGSVQSVYTIQDLEDRIDWLCLESRPSTETIIAAVEEICKCILKIEPTYPILHWEDGMLDIVDPNFLMYIRRSDILDQPKINEGGP